MVIFLFIFYIYFYLILCFRKMKNDIKQTNVEELAIENQMCLYEVSSQQYIFSVCSVCVFCNAMQCNAMRCKLSSFCHHFVITLSSLCHHFVITLSSL